ncbi:hypothetical protein DPMN_068970 [Dreissena polymorpha]|uniref:Uncharacterized protein n=1 Tax=Dreissena polymorpha TaxID=45954 RepID=A0A9D3Z075_DREPO|nr:hypothetical protein DPMN_068970 [Dreissena polymorpha]
MLNNQKANVDEDLKKARRKAYSIFGSGYKGRAGLNVLSIIHLNKSYVLPVLLYGLELLLPPERIINCLEAFQRKFVKEILRLPDNTANAAVYLLSGLLPIEAQIHIQALTFLHTICSQDKNSIEWALLVRQISFKSVDSSSWFIQVQHIIWKYDLGTVADSADNTPTKGKWKTRVLRAVHSYWSDQIDSLTPLYSTLFFLRQDKYVPGKILPLLSLEYTARE